MNENVARPIKMRPRSAKPTRNEPTVEKSERASSPNSSPTTSARRVMTERHLARTADLDERRADHHHQKMSPASRAGVAFALATAHERDAEQERLERDDPRGDADERDERRRDRCADRTDPVKRWETTERGPYKLVAVITHDKYSSSSRTEAAISLIRMPARGGVRQGIEFLVDKYKDEDGRGRGTAR